MGLLEGKRVVVTGSARGIGRAAAELFVHEGARVLINDIDSKAAEEAAAAIGGETTVYANDLTNPDAPSGLIAHAMDAFGGIDIVVNNAGYSWDGVVHKMSDEQFDAMLLIHAVVPFRVARAIAPHWREAAKSEAAEGREVFRKLVNVSSISGTMGNAGQANYAAGKAAVVGLTKSLAKEWGRFKVNCNCVAFGLVDTRLTREKERGERIEISSGHEVALGIPKEMRELAASTIPFGRSARPEEAASPILFLSSQLSNFVNGQVLNVTGGQVAGMCD